MTDWITRKTNLTAHVVQFTRYLREHQFEVGPTEEIDFLECFAAQVPHSFEEQQALYKALFVKNRKNYLRFDDLYRQYWKELERAEDSKTTESEEPSKKAKPSQGAPSLKALKNWLYAGKVSETEDIAAYSAFEALGKKDFAQFATEEHTELRAIIRIIAQRLANKYSRRYVKARRPNRVDLKNTLRKSLKQGGTINEFIFRRQKKRKVNIILLCDVSKSMELYSKFLIDFMYNFQQVVHSLNTYVFSTQLLSLSPYLKDSDFDKALDNLSEYVPNWSGGTRIGESLDQFRSRYGHQLNKDSIVFILSDGWDTGDIELLERSMAHIHRKCERLIWLNPLAGRPDYRPATKGMIACLPYIDVFTSVYNLDSLRQVVRHLRRSSYRSFK
ncbi:MAG: VWA domain-containing protein [Phaeodactylibacter sp.]|nr:VWA domain-containing protein [Phaeodactylibacter sp.]